MVDDVIARHGVPDGVLVEPASAPQPQAPPPAVPAAASQAAPRPLVNRWWGLALAVAAGLVLVASFPPIGQWWAAPIGIGMLAVALHRRGVWYGALLGLIAGLVLMVVLLEWAGG